MIWIFRVVDRVRKADVEYILFLYFFTVSCYGMASNNLITQKICFPQAPPGVNVVCNDTVAINSAANLNQIRSILRQVIPAFTVILGGSWRDVTRQSLPLILLGVCGELLGLVIELAGAVFWNLSANLTFILAATCTALGSTNLLTMASFSYVTEQTTKESRSSRMDMLVITILGSSCLSMILSGIILNGLNYSYFYLFLIVLSCITMIISVLLVNDPRAPSNQGYFKSILRLKAVFTSSGRNNFVIWGFITCIILVNCLLTSEGSISYQFLQTKFKLTPNEMGYLQGYKLVTCILAIAVILPIFRQVLKLSEFKIIAICALSGITTSIGMAFAETRTQLYICASIDFFRLALFSTLYSLFSKTLQKSEIGLYMSLQSFGDGIAPLVVNPLYVYTFNKTISVMPGAFYLISAAIFLIVALLVWILSFYYKEAEDIEDQKPLSINEDEPNEDVNVET